MTDPDSDLPNTPAFAEMRRVRKMNRDRLAAENRALEAKAKSGFTQADIDCHEQWERGQVARELHRRDKLISNLEAFMQRDYNTFMELFSDKYAALVGGTTTN